MDHLHVSYNWINYCALTQVLFPAADQGKSDYVVPIKGDHFWKK